MPLFQGVTAANCHVALFIRKCRNLGVPMCLIKISSLNNPGKGYQLPKIRRRGVGGGGLVVEGRIEFNTCVLT